MFHASLRWDPERGMPFFNFAAGYMKNYMMNHLDNTVSTVRVPINKRREIRRAQRTGWRLYQHSHNYPGRAAIAGAMRMTEPEIEALQLTTAMTKEMGSLDGGYTKDNRDRHAILDVGDGKWKSIDPAAEESQNIEDDVMAHELTKMLNEVLGDSRMRITDREVIILRNRFITHDPKTHKELAETLGISTKRVNQLENQLLAKFRNPFLANKIRDWIES